MNILIQGLPGVGKTTLVRAIAERLSGFRFGGFYTEEIRDRGRRVGFRIQTWSGETGILSHKSFKKGPRVGTYRVDVSGFEALGVTALEKALRTSDIILIDEIGKMELFSRRFQEVVMRCLDSPKPVLATVMSRSHPFVDRIKSRPDSHVVNVTVQNRDDLVVTLSRQIIEESNGIRDQSSSKQESS